ncbi:hypothetical protein D7Z26_07210 [Cohnella endophytica]|uniref:VCBS repeat-containing protein n=1 Tax=Cohnella endophytica TaxID=2419778 RepID=A0A494XWX2_9BACL|nr:hypothetical protein [Cohnella endophytica]RKP55012.1 hypothetical protein D7Z26_07210 [Cohnella endophytica]
MRTISKLARAGFLVAALLYFSGCRMPVTPNELINPPTSELSLPENKWDEIQKLLPKGAQLVPQTLGQGNGIAFGDLDGDGIDEALIVYKENPLHGKTLKAALLKQKSAQWQIVWDTQGFGYGLDYSKIADVNRDGLPEVVLSWSLGNAGTGMDVYVWRNDTLMLQSKEEYRASPDKATVVGGIS